VGKAFVRESEIGDGLDLAPYLRLADRREIIAHSGESPRLGLERNMRYSDKCWTVMLDDDPIALFGYSQYGEDSANIWMLGSDKISEIKWQFLRESKNWIKKIAKDFDRLWAIADVRNDLHTKWYKWLGFTITTTINQGPYDLPFYHIEYMKEEKDV